MLTNFERAQVLIAALPYIRKYRTKTIVVKYGGNAMINEDLKAHVMEDIVLLHMIGVRVVLVHGGGPEISHTMAALGKESTFIGGLRVTDAQTMDIVQMVLAGKVNTTLVKFLETHGAPAVGLSGLDGGLVKATIRDESLGYVGNVTRVNVGVVTDLLDNGYIPVIATIAADDAGNTYNINSDTAAEHIAGALGARRLFLMTDVPGIMHDPSDPASLFPYLTTSEAKDLITKGVVSGGMIPKVECAIGAIAKGVDSAVIIDGRVPHSILMELLTDEGAGTLIGTK